MKGKANPARVWVGPEVQDPKFQDNQFMKVTRLSAQRTGRLYSPVSILGTHLY